MVRVLLILLLLTPFVMGYTRIDEETRKQRKKDMISALQDVEGIKHWFDEHHITNGTYFIHVPRTGGMSLVRAAKKADIELRTWHSARKHPRTDCGCITNVRNPVDRYISEWKYYGLKSFVKKRKMFGWKPAQGFPQTFDEYVKDNSTHNSMTKVLTGCQLYSNCIVDEHSVQNIVNRVKTNCLRVFKTEDMPIHGHQKIFNVDEDGWEEKAREANAVDILLYNELMKIL